MPFTNEEREYLKLLGNNIVKIRKERGIKQKELSGCCQSVVDTRECFKIELNF